MKNGRYDELCAMDKSDLILYVILLEREFNVDMEIVDIWQWIRQEWKE